ncbi:MAG: ATP-binding protein, partial [Thiotrichaceae bacterium]
FKFTPKGFVYLKLNWQANRLKFMVSDSGMGIALETQHKLFTPHYRQKAVSSSSGLGLIVSCHLLKLMGGELLVKSLPNLGATFSGVVDAPYPH